MKQTNKTLSIALAALFTSSLAIAETEVTGKFTYEGAVLTKAGSTIGDFGTSTADSTFGGATAADINPRYGLVTNSATPSHGSGDAMKSEAKAQIFFDGDVGKDSTFHVEVQAVFDGKAVDNYDGVEAYTQRDPLREAYIDTEAGDWSVRAGKQQVVWGTADGIKLLDSINPTDYSEIAQNQLEDSRITVWMLNAEKDLANGGNVQVVIFQPKENIFAGLNRGIDTAVRANGLGTPGTQGYDPVIDSTLNNGTDTGHAFMMQGPDTITGVHNGFLNIVPDLGSVASRFALAFADTRITDNADNNPGRLTITSLSNAGAGGFGTYSIGGSQDGATVAATNINPTGVGAATAVGGFNQTIGGQGFGALGNQNLEGFTVGGFSGISMTQMNGALYNIAVGAAIQAGGTAADAGTQNNDVLSHVPAGFKKAIVDTWNGLMGGYAAAGVTGNDARNAIRDRYGLTQGDGTAIADGTLTAGDLTGAVMLDAGFQPLYNTNIASFTDGKQNSAFEYMTNTTFRTFDAFANARSQYVYNMPEDKDLDIATRFKGSTQSGVNYSINVSYNYDKNPIINLSWRGDAGQELTTHKVTSYYSANAQELVAPQSKTNYDALAANGRAITETLQLVDTAVATAPTDTANENANGNTAGSYYTGDGLYGGTTNTPATLQFSQEVVRVKQLGGSFDTAIETKGLGAVVIRGEVLYTKDGRSPVMDKNLLAIGDLAAALTMRQSDRFKYVLGVDITVLKNMLISTQFIQDRNLDHISNGEEYTADYATMHLNNGFREAEENKEFYSVFFSKPFGASGQHRWNNIFMYENQGSGGKWNRFDLEFGVNDDVVATLEYNRYWGEQNSQFGQLKNSSNIQAGIKYTF